MGYKFGKMLAFIAIMTLVAPGAMGLLAGPHFREVHKEKMNIGSMAFNVDKKIIYAASARNLYILDSESEKVIKKIDVLNSSFSNKSYISDIAFNSNTNKIYFTVVQFLSTVLPNKIVVMNADNYKITKVITFNITTRIVRGNSAILVNEKTNRVYVHVFKSTGNYSGKTFYAVINGNNDSLVNYIPYGALDFAYNDEWVWVENDSYYHIVIKNLATGKKEYEINTTIPWNSYDWPMPPSMHVAGNRIYMVDVGMGKAMVYCADNYTLVGRWDNLGELYDLSAFDSKNKVAYGVFIANGNYTEPHYGVMAISLVNGKKIDEVKSMLVARILGVDPTTHYLYISTKKDENSQFYLASYSLYPNKKEYQPNTVMLITIAAVTAAIIIVVVYAKKIKIREK